MTEEEEERERGGIFEWERDNKRKQEKGRGRRTVKRQSERGALAVVASLREGGRITKEAKEGEGCRPKMEEKWEAQVEGGADEEERNKKGMGRDT